MGAACPTAIGAALVGSGLVGLFGVLTVRKSYQTQPLFYAVLLFVLLNAAGAAYARPFWGHPSRYRIYSCVALAVSYLVLAQAGAARFPAKIIRMARCTAMALALIYLPIFGLGLPFFVDCYRATNLRYEQNVVLSFYDHGELDRTHANQVMMAEVDALYNRRIIQILPARMRAWVAAQFQARTEYVTGDQFPWWRKHVPRFAHSLQRAQDMGLYDVSNLRRDVR